MAGKYLMIAFATCSALPAVQSSNQITMIEPSSAPSGTSGLSVAFTLDTDMPPAPPAGVLPQSVMLGSLVGTSVDHPSQYTVSARFNLPAEESGAKDATITFETPNGTLVFAMTGGFTVTAPVDTPPTITQHPESHTLAPGQSVNLTVTASGSAPLEYQWQKDNVDLAGGNSTALALVSVTAEDAGIYRCRVSNAYGSEISRTAVLTVSANAFVDTYPPVDTGQASCYNTVAPIICGGQGQAFYGQDAQYTHNEPDFSVSGDGLTVLDRQTGLVWQRSADRNRDGNIDAADKLGSSGLQSYVGQLNTESFGGHGDWRLPTIKQLYSLIEFSGTDPSGYSGSDTSGLQPFIDTAFFDFGYGDTTAGERIIDAQYASSTSSVSMAYGAKLFGVNFADGRIKGYDLILAGEEKTFYVICVRGNADYGMNRFVSNGDGTITDLSTRLMWQQSDDGTAISWENALAYAEDLTLAGHEDWRLPNVKELQSIVDYTRSPDTHGTAAIDPVFACTPIINEAGAQDYGYYWSSTTHVNLLQGGTSASYVCFGRGLGYMTGSWIDVHGAGCQRSDPKTGDPADYPTGHGPQGDAIRIYNFVRAVRHAYSKADLDTDHDVDMDDMAVFFDCSNGPALPLDSECRQIDLDDDGDADASDFGILQLCVSGSGAQASLTCPE